MYAVYVAVVKKNQPSGALATGRGRDKLGVASRFSNCEGCQGFN